MRKSNTNLAIALLLIAGFMGCKQSDTSKEELITVDVNASYPEKELILQDIMDVEYVPLETTDEFVTQGIVEAVGKDILLVRNWNDGDIFVFDRATGKGIRKINRFGQGAEEYTNIAAIILDEDNKEIFVKDHPSRKIMVYDLSGNFKRSFKFADTGYYDDIFNYDRDHLISYKKYFSEKENEQACHLIISKQDGSITQEIKTPFKEIKLPIAMKDEYVIMPEYHQTFPALSNWALVNTSSDTIYNYSPEGSLTPMIVRTPSIQSMEVEVFLFPTVITDRYCFMRTIKKEVDFKTFKGFPSTDLVYDKQEKAIFKYSLYNDDYSNKQEVSLFTKPGTPPIAVCQSLEAHNLIEAYEKGQLKGKLKEIAANLDEESNQVIMLIKYKK